MPGRSVSSRGSAGWRTKRQVITLQTDHSNKIYSQASNCFLVDSGQINHLKVFKEKKSDFEDKMFGEKDCRQTDGLRQHFSACLSECLCVHTIITKHPSLPNPTAPTNFSLIPSHCTAFTHDVNTDAPRKPQLPPPPTVC